MLSLLALCIPLLKRCFSLPDTLLQGCQPALPLLLALLAKEFTGHPLQGEDTHSLCAHTYSNSLLSLCKTAAFTGNRNNDDVSLSVYVLKYYPSSKLFFLLFLMCKVLCCHLQLILDHLVFPTY